MRIIPSFTVAMMLGIGSAQAGEINLPGALDLIISGDSDFEVEYADEDFRFGRSDVADDPNTAVDESTDGRQFFFNQDHEIRFRAIGVADATGLEYGANLELELQTGSASNGTNANWDEAWTFFRGNWGEFRLGNEDAPAEILSTTAANVAFGTEGVDGDLRITPEFVIADSEEATKIIYFTPSFAGFEAGASYTINAGDSGSQIGTTADAEDIVNLVGRYENSFGGFDLSFSGAVVFAGNTPEGDSTNWALGASVEAYGIGIAGYYGDEDGGFARDGLGGESRDDFFNIGIGGEVLGNVGLSYNFQRDEFDGGSTKSTHIVGATLPLLPGVALRTDIGYQDQEIEGADNIDGFNALAQLHLEF